jgi:hypothetical protein
MHLSLKAPLEACEKTRRELLAVFARAAPEIWETRLDGQGWSLAEQLDHLIRAEVGTSKMARKLIRGDFRGVARSHDASLFDSTLHSYPYGRLPAPAPLVPSRLPFEDARPQLVATHERFLEELGRFGGPDADGLAAPDPDTGVWFTLGGWVRVQALHEAHHISQIRALLARLTR